MPSAGGLGYTTSDRRLIGGTMMSIRKHATRVLVGVLAVVMLTIGGLSAAAQMTSRHPTITAEQAIACIRTAGAAKPGLVKEIEAEDERGSRLCEVKIVAENGQEYKVYVDVSTDKVVKIKED
jgi:Zn-dependent metalloprotease